MIDEKVVIHILDQGPHFLKLEITFSLESGAFDGHFPGFPLLAGVLQIHLAMSLFQKHQCQQISFAGFKSIKFFHPIFPGNKVQLLCQNLVEKGEFIFQYSQGDKIYSKGVARLRNE